MLLYAGLWKVMGLIIRWSQVQILLAPLFLTCCDRVVKGVAARSVSRRVPKILKANLGLPKGEWVEIVA